MAGSSVQPTSDVSLVRKGAGPPSGCVRVARHHPPNVSAPIAAIAANASALHFHTRAGADTGGAVTPCESGFVSHVLQRDFQIRHRLPTPLGILPQAAEDQPLEITRQVRDRIARRVRLSCQDCREGRHFGRAGEHATAGDHFIEHRAKREDIRSGIRGFSLGLFGRHVGGGAEDRAFLGLQTPVCGRGSRRHPFVDRLAAGVGELRQSEVEHLEWTFIADHDVGRLEVPVKNAGGVCGCQRVRDLNGVAERGADTQPAAANQMSERGARDVLHRDEVDAVGLPDLINRDDVRMIQGGSGSGLLNEALTSLSIDRAIRLEQLDRDGPAEARIDGAVDDAHPAFAERLQDLVM